MASIPASLMGRIARNGVRGKSARHFLRRSMAQLSPEEIAKLPASTLKRISRELRAAATAQARGIEAVVSQESAPASPGPIGNQRKPSLIMILIKIVLIAVVLAVLAVNADRPVRWGLFQLGVLSSQQLGLCQRLDRWTDGCSFKLQIEGIPIERIAELVDLPVPVLTASNPTMSPYTPLPKGSVVRIERSGVKK
jgi:hypothetical protein